MGSSPSGDSAVGVGRAVPRVRHKVISIAPKSPVLSFTGFLISAFTRLNRFFIIFFVLFLGCLRCLVDRPRILSARCMEVNSIRRVCVFLGGLGREILVYINANACRAGILYFSCIFYLCRLYRFAMYFLFIRVMSSQGVSFLFFDTFSWLLVGCSWCLRCFGVCVREALQHRLFPVCGLGICVDAAEPLSPLTADRPRFAHIENTSASRN